MGYTYQKHQGLLPQDSSLVPDVLHTATSSLRPLSFSKAGQENEIVFLELLHLRLSAPTSFVVSYLKIGTIPS